MSRTTNPASGFYGWKLVIVLFFGMAINTALPVYGLGLLNVHMADEIGFNRATLGTAFAVYMLMTGLPGPLVAKLIEAVGIRWTLAIGNAMLLLGSVAMATIVTSTLSLIIASGLMIGGASAVGGPIPIQALVTRWFARRRALAMGLVLAGSGVAGILFPPLLEHIVSGSGWRAGWWLIAASAGAIIGAILLFVRDRPEDLGETIDGIATPPGDAPDDSRKTRARVYQTREHWQFRDVATSRTFWLLMACSIGVSSVYTIFFAQAVLQIRDLGYSTRTASYLLSMAVAIGFAAHMLISFVGDRIDPKALWSISLLLQGIGIGLFAAAGEPWLLYPAVICLGIGNSGSIFCLIMTFGNWFGESAAPFVFGFGSAFSAACGALAPIASGYSYDRFGTFAPVFYAVAAGCVVGAIALWRAEPPRLARA